VHVYQNELGKKQALSVKETSKLQRKM